MNNKTKKDQKPKCHFRGVRSKSRVMRVIPAHSLTGRCGGDHLSHPSGPTPFKGPAHPHSEKSSPSESEQGKLLLVLAPSCYGMGPNKALIEFLVWPLINFYWFRSPGTLVSKNIKHTVNKYFLSEEYLKSIGLTDKWWLNISVFSTGT